MIGGVFKGRLFWRYFAWFVFVSSILWIPGTVVEMWLAHRDGVASAGQLQQAETMAARRLIEGHLQGIESLIRDVSGLPWRQGLLTPEDRRLEFQRLLKISPVIHEIHRWDASGRETLYVSRIWGDRVGATNPDAKDAKAPLVAGDGPVYGDVSFRDGLEPFVPITLRETNSDAPGTITALLDLKFIADYVSEVRVGKAGRAYLTDKRGTIIAHPDADRMLRRHSVEASPEFRTVMRAMERGEPLNAMQVADGTGSGKFVSAIVVPTTGWLLFVEQSADEVLLPVRQALERGAAIFAIGIVLAFFASLWSARALTGPIVEVGRGARKIAEGDLGARIAVKTGDEIEALASEFNRMAAQLQEYTTGLEKKVEEKTAELQDALKLAHDAMRARALFLAAASHDLRQPLYAISILADTLASDALQPTAMAVLEKQRVAIAVLRALFENLLDLSRFDAGEVRPMLRVVSLRDVLAPSILEHEVICQAKGLQFDHDIEQAWVQTDPDLLRRVAGNLLSNAARYTPAGTVTFNARIADGHVWLRIADTGIGIAPEDQSRIFEEFVQVANPARERDKGVGLGLSIVRRIATLLDMDLTLHSTPSVGTTVTFRIPVAENIHGVTAQEDLTYAAAGAFKGARIWIVEDDPLVRDALSLQFNIWDALPAFASSVAELLVLQGVDGRWPDAAIVDDMLGADENGLEIASFLREFMPESRIVLVTGNVDPVRTQALEESGLVVLRKPLASGDLAQWLRQALETPVARASPVREPAG